MKKKKSRKTIKTRPDFIRQPCNQIRCTFYRGTSIVFVCISAWAAAISTIWQNADEMRHIFDVWAVESDVPVNVGWVEITHSNQGSLMWNWNAFFIRFFYYSILGVSVCVCVSLNASLTPSYLDCFLCFSDRSYTYHFLSLTKLTNPAILFSLRPKWAE